MLSLGKFWRRLKGLNSKAKLFLCLASWDCGLNVVLSVIQLTTGFDSVGTTSTDTGKNGNGIPVHVYWSMLEIMTVLFFFYFAWDCVLTENVYELAAFQLARFLATVYAAVQYFLVKGERNRFNLVQLVLMALFQCVFWSIALQTHRSFGWWSFRRLGADTNLKKYFKTYQLFIAQSRFDMQFGLLMVLMSVFFFGADSSPAFLIVEVAMLGITIFYNRIGITAIREEQEHVMRWFFILGSVGPVNIVVKAALMIKYPSKFGRNAPYVQIGLTALGALVNRVTLLLNGLRCFRNFHKGLKENAFSKLDDDSLAAPLMEYTSFNADILTPATAPAQTAATAPALHSDL
eukprot:c11847_g1_i1.p1 GENE.c11847_g1_i1~~c11847_g1_i1.p1  ORF type:complete len:347 (+),score=85.31 c11847_g1_i1:265-1305(+)